MLGDGAMFGAASLATPVHAAYVLAYPALAACIVSASGRCRSSQEQAAGAQFDAEAVHGEAAAAAAAGGQGLQTEYVQSLLSHDPVISLGMRVVPVSHCTLEFVSLEEAQRDLRALPRSLPYARLHAGAHCGPSCRFWQPPFPPSPYPPPPPSTYVHVGSA
jgi:hypothetical protein